MKKHCLSPTNGQFNLAAIMFFLIAFLSAAFVLTCTDDSSTDGEASANGETDDDDNDNNAAPPLRAEVGIFAPEEGNVLARRIVVTTNLPCSLSAVATTPLDTGFSQGDPEATEEGTNHTFWFYGFPEDADCEFSVHVAGDPSHVAATGTFSMPPLEPTPPRLYEIENTGEAAQDEWIGATVTFAANDGENVGYYTALIIYDREGRIRFYHCNPMILPNGAQQQMTGLTRLSSGELLVSNTIDLIAVRPDGAEYRYIDLHPADPIFQSTHHLFYLFPDEQHALVLFNSLGAGVACDNLTPTDRVVGDGVALVNRAGTELRRWSAFDHLEEIPQASTDPLSCYAYHFGSDTTDWTHGNCVDFRPDRNTFLVSLRNVLRIVNVDARTGEILWQMGPGLDFTWLGDENENDQWFLMQHGPRWLPDGNLLLFDNGNCRGFYNCMHGPYSRALELAVDEEAMTVTKVWEYRVPFSHAIGNIERHANGNTLITNGWNGFIVEATPDGRSVWSGTYLASENITTVRYVPALWDYEAESAAQR